MEELTIRKGDDFIKLGQAVKAVGFVNLPVMSITGDSLDARGSRGVQFISSGNWSKYLAWRGHCRSWVVVFITVGV